MQFLDDIAVKGPKTTYGNRKSLPGIRQFVVEHLILLDLVLADLELAGCTISGEKSQFGMSGIKIVGYVCDAEGRRPDRDKIAKIVNWTDFRDLTSVRAFMGVCTYYRI